MKAYRHGEIAFCQINKLPKGLKEAQTKTIMTGSHGHNHDFNNGKLYLKDVDDYIFGYFEAENTSLIHPEHSPKIGDANLPNGVYELRRQNEFTPEGLTPVAD